MYKDDCVIAILHKGKVLRETSGDVHLPFGSEYKIRAKNTGTGRVKVKVSVDGTYIHPESNSFIINSGNHLDLERMITDGDLSSGPKLKFVSLSDGRVQDPTNSENGIIKVEFYREYIRPAIYKYDGPDFDMHWFGTNNGDTFKYSTDISNSFNCSGDLGDAPVAVAAACPGPVAKSSNGATVEGRKSRQAFSLAEDFATVSFPTTLTLTLHGLEKPTFVEDTKNKFCDDCGRKNRYKAKFCSNCGRKI